EPDGPIPPQEMAHTATAILPVSQRILPSPSPSDETWARSSDGQANGAALPDVGTLSRSPAASATAERGKSRKGTSRSGGAFDARVLQPIGDLVLPIDEDRVVRAGLLAFAAAGAVLLDHRDDAEEARRVSHRNHLERLERAPLDALLAAGAALFVDEGDGPLGLLQ